MAGIISNVDSDVQNLRKLKNEIEQVKKALLGINIKVDIDIAKDLEAQLRSLTSQYDALVDKIAAAEGKIMLSTKRINEASEKIIQAQEKLSIAPSVVNAPSVEVSGVANIQAQTKAYADLKTEIDDILGTRNANVRRMIEEVNAIRLINAEIKKITKTQGDSASLSSAQQKRLEHLNNSLLTHKEALADVRRTLSNNVKLDNVAATSMNGLSQSLSRMRIAYRDLTEAERNSPFGKQLLASINQADAKIKELDATIGNHQRNIGNYGQAWNGLSMSIQQIGRELPALAYGPKVFFSAISNNLPILADEIKRARTEYEMLKKSGQSAIPVWKQIVSSLFSWQSALTVGITLLTLYGDKVIDWVSGLFKAKDALSGIATYQQNISRIMSDAANKTANERAELDILYKATQNYTKSLKEKNAAVDELKKKYPSYFGNLTNEAILAGKASVAYENLKNNIVKAAQARSAMNIITENYDKIYQLQKAVNADTNWINRNKEKTKDGTATTTAVIGTSITGYTQSGQVLTKEAEEYNRRTQALAKNKKIIELLEQSNDELAKSIDITNLIENKGGLSVQSEKLRKENEKYNILLDKQKLEQLRKSQDIENQLEQSEINRMADGTEKTIRQRELNNKLEIQAIERQKEDYIKAIIQAEKDKFDAEEDIKASKDKNYKKKTFDASSVSVDTFRFDTIISNTKFAQERKFGDELLKQYQFYTDERLSIEKKFNDDIILLQEARKKAAANGNTDEISKIDRSIAKATADKGKALMKHDFGILKQSPEYIRAFEDLRNTSSETLSSLLEQLENAKDTAASVLNPEDLREYTTTIQDIMDELEGRNPFQSLADRQRELAEAERELAEAKRQLDAVMNGAKIVTGIKSTKLGADGLINIENTYLSAEDALKKYNKAKDKAYKSNNNFIKAEKRAKKSVDELANAIKSIGDSIGGQSGEIISLIGDVSLFASKSIDGITMVAKTGAEAMSAVEKASVILGIVSAGIQLLQKLNSLLPTAESRYEEFAAKVAEINKLTEAVNEYRIAAIEARHAEEGWFSENGLKGLRNYREVHDEVFKAYKDKVNEQQAVYQNKKGGGWLTGSLGYGLLGGIDAIFGTNILGNKYDKNTIEAIKNLRIETRGRSRGLFGSGIFGHSQETEDLISWARNNGFGELFGKDNLINKDAAKAIIDKYGDKLVGQTKETLETLIKLREKYDEYIEKLHEYVNSLYEPLVDKFVDSIWTWLSDGKDALKSFREYAGDTFKDIANDMLKSIVLSKIFGKGENSYQSKINKAYEDYAKKLIDEVELNRRVSELTKELMGTAEQQLPVIQGMAKNINDTMKNIAGIDLVNGSFSQESTRKGFETMTQDQAGELNGRFTALQVTGEEMKLQNIAQSQSLNILTMKAEDILSVSTDTRNIADDIRTTIADSYLELVQISENTGAIIKPIRQMQKDIAEVKKNTSKL
ncbi:hypothetical protein ACFX5L_09025 [Bacteroides sp. KG123]|uniref:hypothetical protein n=1 Tax=unclassified Bacteroides TaxID=2646097 RepID=UPI003D7F3876